MIGARSAKQGLANNAPKNSKLKTKLCGRPFKKASIASDSQELILYHRLESIRQFHTKTATVLLDDFLRMETGSRIAIMSIQKIVNTG